MKNIIHKVKKAHKGFTIVQMVIAMLIFAVLSGVAFLGSNVYTNQANVTRVQSDLASYNIALQTAMLSNPNTASGATATDGDAMADILNKYLTDDLTLTTTDGGGTSALIDPWGNAYLVEVSEGSENLISSATRERVVHIYSFGSDATQGGGDDCLLVVQYADGAVTSQVTVAVDYEASAIVD